jgi:hypothetical protein
MKRLRLVCLIVFAVQIIAVLTWANLHRTRVLIVQSYDTTYPWTAGIDAGLDGVLRQHRDLVVRRHYMDTKRHPWTGFKESAGLAARSLVDRWNPAIVIAVDDDAQQYVARHLAGRSLVFTGVNQDPAIYGYAGRAQVTGLHERLPLAAVREGLSLLVTPQRTPGPPRIAFVGDRSETVAGDAAWVQEFAWAPAQLAGVFLVDDLPAFEQAIDQASAVADVILTSGYRRIVRVPGTAELVPPDEVVAVLLRRSRVPVVGANTFFVTDGGALAIATAPREQGEVAARMAVRIASGEAPGAIPWVDSHQFVIAMSASRMLAAGMTLPTIYEATARAAGHWMP